MCASSTVRVEAAAAAADSAAGAAAVSVVSSAVCYVIKARKSMLGKYGYSYNTGYE
jgi:hypothetical protein